MIETKVCITCKEEKEVFYFSSDSSRKDGLYPKCKECINRRRQELYLENKDKIQARNSKWRSNNKEWVTTYSREAIKRRRKEDSIFKLSDNTRHLIKESFKRACDGRYRKSKRTEELLGCSLIEFLSHLESLFQEGMTFENHGNCEECWHIDHKIPLATAETEEDIVRLNHYTNLQPLWATENLQKGKNITISTPN